MPAVYTRTGDRGETGLFGGTRVGKQDPRVEAYGTVDEANASLGLAKAGLEPGEWRERVHQIQHRLFVLGAELASDEKGAAILDNKVCTDDIVDLERLIDDCLAVTGPQRAFVVPGRDARSAAFHLARTTVRRAERRTLTLAETEGVRPELIKYLNRLSDATYALARLTEHWADLALIEATVRKAVATQLNQSGAQTGIAAQESGEFDLATAKALATAAETKALMVGVPIVFAAVDAAGNLMLVHRMADSLLASIDIAINKAWSSAAFKQTTATLGAQAAPPGAPLPGLADGNNGRVVLFGGGFPVFHQGKIAGGLGVSGGTVEEDIEIATWAMNQVMGADK